MMGFRGRRGNRAVTDETALTELRESLERLECRAKLAHPVRTARTAQTGRRVILEQTDATGWTVVLDRPDRRVPRGLRALRVRRATPAKWLCARPGTPR